VLLRYAHERYRASDLYVTSHASTLMMPEVRPPESQ